MNAFCLFTFNEFEITDAMAAIELGKFIEKQLLSECPGKKPPLPAPVEKPEGGEEQTLEENGEVDEGSSTHAAGSSKGAAGSSTDAASHGKHIGSV